jgi:hypothetical protein
MDIVQKILIGLHGVMCQKAALFSCLILVTMTEVSDANVQKSFLTDDLNVQIR